MLPENLLFNTDAQVAEPPSKTYRINTAPGTVAGFTDGIEAIKQQVYKILHTERYRHIIYSRSYGVELANLLGEPIEYAIPEVKRRITEALLQDSRIIAVDNFECKTDKGKVIVSFCVYSVYGNLDSRLEVEI